MFAHLKAQLMFHRFHLRGKLGAKIDVGLALMALNLRKLGKYMEQKARKEEKTRPILTIIIKIGLVFFLGKDYCPTLFFVGYVYAANKWINDSVYSNSLESLIISSLLVRVASAIVFPVCFKKSFTILYPTV